MTHTDYPVLREQVAATVVDDYAVVILADDGIVNVLNPLGARIWALIDGRRTVGDIAAVIASEYDVRPEVAARDTAEFVQTLVDTRAVVLQPTAVEGL
jgi:glutamine phosphoribosylpyrophosphate amidotransferase